MSVNFFLKQRKGVIRLPKEDVCPKCEESGMEYEEDNHTAPDDDQLHMTVKCKCGYEGREVYNFEFIEYQED